MNFSQLLPGEDMEQSKKRKSWELPQSLWELAKPLVTKKPGTVGSTVSVNLQQILAVIFDVLRTGCQWQSCPRELFGPPSTVHYDHQKWCHDGVFEHLGLKALAIYEDRQGLQWEWPSGDGAMTKAPLGGEATGSNPSDRGKRGTKRSLLTDGNGIP